MIYGDDAGASGSGFYIWTGAGWHNRDALVDSIAACLALWPLLFHKPFVNGGGRTPAGRLRNWMIIGAAARCDKDFTADSASAGFLAELVDVFLDHAPGRQPGGAVRG